MFQLGSVLAVFFVQLRHVLCPDILHFDRVDNLQLQLLSVRLGANLPSVLVPLVLCVPILCREDFGVIRCAMASTLRLDKNND